MVPLAPSRRFWQHLERLLMTSEIVIDRPTGSRHPRYPEIVYPLAYGYLAGTSAGDGDGIDAWIGSEPGQALVAVVCTVDLVKQDTEVKLLLGCTPDEVAAVVAFHNRGPQAAILVARNPRRAA
jgi:inorganic pyrophosphatase